MVLPIRTIRRVQLQAQPPGYGQGNGRVRTTVAYDPLHEH